MCTKLKTLTSAAAKACRVLATGAGISLLYATTTWAAPLRDVRPSTDSVTAAALETTVSQLRVAALRWSAITDVSAELQQAYRARDWAPFWSRDGMPTRQATLMLAELRRLDDRGLSAADFDARMLSGLALQAPLDPDLASTFDAGLSVAALRVARALQHGWTLPSQGTVGGARDGGTTDLADALSALATASSPAVILDTFEPQHDAYRRLKRALPTYRSQAALGASHDTRVASIVASMEQWRRLPHILPASAIIVNVPAFVLQATMQRRDGSIDTLRMDVVVGDLLHRTPIFSDSLQYIELSPYWNVPTSIVRAELLPLARRDPHILTMNNYEIVDRRQRVLPVTFATVRAVDRGMAYIRQLPGGTNSLGRAKFIFPNSQDIYLHDTPSRGGFQSAQRALSHGCVRVADPKGLAMLLLREDSTWTPARIEEAMNGRVAERITLAARVPVYIMYATAAMNEHGEMEFHDDLYGRDHAFDQLLSKGSESPESRLPETITVESGRNSTNHTAQRR